MFKDDCPFKIGDRVCHNSYGAGTVVDPDLIPEDGIGKYMRVSNSFVVWLKLDTPTIRSKYFQAFTSSCTLISKVAELSGIDRFCVCPNPKPVLILVSITCDKCGKEVNDAL
jgi:hypothetical protein